MEATLRGINMGNFSWKILIRVEGKSYGIDEDGFFFDENAVVKLENTLKDAHVFRIVSGTNAMWSVNGIISNFKNRDKCCDHCFVETLINVLENPSR